MPRPRKPTSLLLLNGGLAHDKKRYAHRANEPVEERELGPFEPMKYLEIDEAWEIIVSSCPAGVLRKRDRILVMRAAILYRDQHNAVILADAEGKVISNTSAYLAAEKQLKQFLSTLGLSPTDASKVTAVKSKTAHNDFDD